MAMFRDRAYFTPPAIATRAEARDMLQLDPDARMLVVSFGGGQGTEPIWQSILRSLYVLRKRFDYAYLSAGPYLEGDAYERLHSQVTQHPNWKWIRLLNPLPAWIKASDFFLGSGGHTSLTV